MLFGDIAITWHRRYSVCASLDGYLKMTWRIQRVGGKGDHRGQMAYFYPRAPLWIYPAMYCHTEMKMPINNVFSLNTAACSR